MLYCSLRLERSRFLMRTVKITTTVNIKLHEMRRIAWLRAFKKESGALEQLVIFVTLCTGAAGSICDLVHWSSWFYLWSCALEHLVLFVILCTGASGFICDLVHWGSWLYLWSCALGQLVLFVILCTGAAGSICDLVHWGSWFYLWSCALRHLVIFVQRTIKGDAQHIDKLHFVATSVSFAMDIVILIQRCRATHLYSLCDRPLFVTVYLLCVTCVTLRY